MYREAEFCIRRSNNTLDIVLLPQGLHNEPQKLRAEVQKALDRICDRNNQPYDASLLGYGLCSNGIVGLSAKIPIVVPRGHDCITLLLGSRQKYKEYFESHKGTYWYSSGWIETNMMPGKERCENQLNEYKKKYGSDNAEYLMNIEQQWIRQYQRATYIDWGFEDSAKQKEFTKKCAEFLGWKYDEIKGSPSLMQRLVDGQWDEKDFLVVPPGRKITENLTTDEIIDTQPVQPHQPL
ncbi:MAG: DUF1638 domain-containing protein [Phycisphaerae bacterium]